MNSIFHSWSEHSCATERTQGGFEMLRKRNSSWSSYTVLTVVIVCLAAGSASAQITQDEPTDTYQVTYYSNALLKWPDGTVHIVNPGTSLTKIDANGRPLNGNLCADIYVLNNDQQVVECCGCLLTPDAEKTLSIDSDLLSNPINPKNVTTDGVIKAVSAAPGSSNVCNPSTTTIKPTAALRLWATHIQVQPYGSYPETEEEFAAAPLSVYELSNLENQCSAIVTSGSGYGICTCGI
jgi:hypothetical protein